MIYGVGGGLNRLLSFLFLPLFTSYLTPADYGISSILSVIAFFITPLFSLGLGAAIGIPYFEERQHDQKSTTIWTSFGLLLISVSVMLLSGFSFATPISRLVFQNEGFANLVIISLLSTSLSILSIPFMLRLQFDERVRAFVILTFVSSVSTTGFTIWKVVVMHQGVIGLLEANLLGQFVTLTLFMMATLPTMPLLMNWKIAGALLKLGIPLIPSFAFLFVIQHGNKYILQWSYGLDTVGIYTVGFNLGMFMSLPVTAFQNAWYPYFMSYIERQAEAPGVFSRVLTYYMLSFGALSLLFFIFAQPLVVVMTQPAFHEAYKVVGFVASGQFLIGISSILLPGIYFAKKVKYVTVIQFVAAIIGIIANIVLIHWFGMLGAAMSLPIAILALNITEWIWNNRQGYLKVPYETKRIVKFAVVYLVIVVLSMLAIQPSLVVQIMWASMLFVCTCFCLIGMLSRAERAYVLRLVRILLGERRRHHSIDNA